MRASDRTAAGSHVKLRSGAAAACAERDAILRDDCGAFPPGAASLRQLASVPAASKAAKAVRDRTKGDSVDQLIADNPLSSLHLSTSRLDPTSRRYRPSRRTC